jgi:hypothetical protein
VKPFAHPYALMTLFLLAGCGRNPNVEVVGSYFPGWMISLCVGVALTGAAYAVLRTRRQHHSIGHPAVVYPGMVLFFTCLLWLCLFA